MAETFGVDDFELIIREVKDKDRKDLCKRLYAEWKERWSAYLKHLKENEQEGLLRRIENRSEDHHGVETKKFLKLIFKTEKYGDYDVEALVSSPDGCEQRCKIISNRSGAVAGSAKA